MTLAASQTLTATGVQVTLTNATVNGPGTLTNASGETLTLSDTKVNAPLVNQGTVAVTNTGNTIAGGFTASAGSTLNLSDNNNYAQLTFSGGFTNDGTIALSTNGHRGLQRHAYDFVVRDADQRLRRNHRRLGRPAPIR